MSDILIGKGEYPVSLLAKYGNRHGLVAGATGTGKSVSLMVLAEGFSRMGVPVFMADVKGDLAGIAKPGANHPKVKERAAQLGRPPGHGVLVTMSVHRLLARRHQLSRRIPVGKPLREVDRAVPRGDARHLADQRLGEDGGAARRAGHGRKRRAPLTGSAAPCRSATESRRRAPARD
mgnify:CR=1 FL=1